MARIIFPSNFLGLDVWAGQFTCIYLFFFWFWNQIGVFRYAYASARDQKYQKMSEILFILEVLDLEVWRQQPTRIYRFFMILGSKLWFFRCARKCARPKISENVRNFISFRIIGFKHLLYSLYVDIYLSCGFQVNLVVFFWCERGCTRQKISEYSRNFIYFQNVWSTSVNEKT